MLFVIKLFLYFTLQNIYRFNLNLIGIHTHTHTHTQTHKEYTKELSTNIFNFILL